jgi:anti-sigma factor RsiW
MAESADHITCRELVELVTDYLEGALPADRVELLEQHVSFCQGCATYVDQMRIAIDAVGRIGEGQVPPAMRERLLAAFRESRSP